MVSLLPSGIGPDPGPRSFETSGADAASIAGFVGSRKSDARVNAMNWT